jgi:hypothetical protein
MRKLFVCAVLAALTVISPSLFAQDKDRGEIGAFFDYNRNENLGLNQYGFGGRLGFNVKPNLQLEAEGAYDFRRSFTANIPTAIPPTTFPANLRTTLGLFGIKAHTTGPVRLFGVLKGGFVNFSVGNPSSVASGFTSTINNITDGDTHPVFYPGAGIEMFAKWFGVRAEIGDMMWFNRDATDKISSHNNMRITFGPQFRF